MVLEWKREGKCIWRRGEGGSREIYYLPSFPSRWCICIMQWLSLPIHVQPCSGHSLMSHRLLKEPCRLDSGLVHEVVSHRAWRGDEWEDRVLWWLQGIYRLAYHDWLIDENQPFPWGPALRLASFVDVVVAVAVVGGSLSLSLGCDLRQKREGGICWRRSCFKQGGGVVSKVKNWWWIWHVFLLIFCSTGVLFSVWDRFGVKSAPRKGYGNLKVML